uniref:Peptidase A2 domain-containing protein n=1 Tax=Amphimedon queenslandica TaxID=400682 RepID=A0A1X7VFZ8_AMPQE
MDAKLTLDGVKRRAHQREAIGGQQGKIHNKSLDIKVEHIKGEKNPPPKPGAQYRGRAVESRGQHKDNGRSSSGRCTLCGRGKHAQHECHATGAVCHLVRKRGLFQAHCFHATQNKQPSSSKVGAVTGLNEEDLIYPNAIGIVDAIHGNEWLNKITINDTETVLKLDTGEEVTLITEEVLKSLGCRRKLLKPADASY